MATTTASVSISSSDLQVGNQLALNASTTCMKAGLTAGLEKIEIGKNTLTVADGSTQLKLATTAGVNGASKVYLCNNATDETFYIRLDLHDTIVGRLYAGDWLFIPWSQNDTTNELVIEAVGGSCDYEYAIFKEDETVVSAL
tara:strand:+ start:141 stop:566 length:426 start_codon:yes stop_codon:yes gene_type:complete